MLNGSTECGSTECGMQELGHCESATIKTPQDSITELPNA